jgi:hypothetical protein
MSSNEIVSKDSCAVGGADTDTRDLELCHVRRPAPENKCQILDIDALELAEVDAVWKGGIIANIIKSWKQCIVPIDKLRSGDKSPGLLSALEPKEFLQELKEEGMQVLLLRAPIGEGPNQKFQVVGGFLYSTSGHAVLADKDLEEPMKRAANISSHEKVGWLLSAWIRDDYQGSGYYQDLVLRAVSECIERGMDRFVGYVREWPCANECIKAHKAVGFMDLEQGIFLPFPKKTDLELNALAPEEKMRALEVQKYGGIRLRFLEFTLQEFEKRANLIGIRGTRFETINNDGAAEM